MSNLFWYAPSWEQAEDFKPNLGAARRSATGRARVKYMPPPSNMKRRLLAAGVSDRRWEREEHARRMDRREKHGAAILAESQAQRANGESVKPFEPRNTRERVHVRRGLDPDQTTKAELYRSLRHERAATPGCHRFHASATSGGAGSSLGAASSTQKSGTATTVPDLRLTQQSTTSSATYRGAHAPTGQCYATYPAHADDTNDAGVTIGTGRALPRSQPASPEHTPRRPASASPRKSARGVQLRDAAVETAERARHVSHMEPTVWAPGETRPSIWHLKNANPHYETPADAARAEAAEAGRRLHHTQGSFKEDPATKKKAFVHRDTAEAAVGPDSPLSTSGRFSDKGGWSTADTQNPPSKSASMQPSPASGRSGTTPKAWGEAHSTKGSKGPLPEPLGAAVIPMGRMPLADDGVSDIGESSFEAPKRGPMGSTVSDTRKAAPKRSAVSYATSDDQRPDTSGGERDAPRAAAAAIAHVEPDRQGAEGEEAGTARHHRAGRPRRSSPATQQRAEDTRCSTSDDDSDDDHPDYRGVIPDLSRVPPRPDFRTRLTPRGASNVVDSARTNRSGGTPTRRSRGDRTPNRSMLTPPHGSVLPPSGTGSPAAGMGVYGPSAAQYAGYPHQPQVVIVAGGRYSPGPVTGGSFVGGLMSAPGSAPGHPPPHPYFYPQGNGTWAPHFPPPHPDRPQAYPHGPYANGAMPTPAAPTTHRSGTATPMGTHYAVSTPGAHVQQQQPPTGYAQHGGIPFDAAGSPVVPPDGSVIERGPRLTPTRRHQRHYAARAEDGDAQEDYSVHARPRTGDAAAADDDASHEDQRRQSKRAAKPARPPYDSSDVDEYERRAAEYQEARRFLDDHDDRSPAKSGDKARPVTVPMVGAVQDDRVLYSSESAGTPPNVGFSTVQQRSRDAAAQLQRDDSDSADDFEVHRARPL